MKVVRRRKIHKGFVDVRDYELAEALKKGGLIVVVGRKRMTLTPEQIEKLAVQLNGFKKFQSKYGKPYYLWSFYWSPDKEKTAKKELKELSRLCLR